METGDLREAIVRAGVVVHADSNAPFLLDDAASAWFVESGCVEVFSVQLAGGRPVGARAHFCSIEEGQLLAGLPIDRSGGGHGLLAVGLMHTRLRAFPLSALRALAANPSWRPAVVRLLDGWIAALSAGVSRDVKPRTDVVLAANAAETIAAGRRFRSSDGVQWVDAGGAELLFVDMEEVAGVGPASLFPISQDAWLRTLADVRVTARGTADALDDDALWRGLEIFGRTVCQCEALNRRLTDVDEYNRARDRLDASRLRAGEALGELAGVLERASDAFDSPVTDPLFLAAHVVGI
jgi:hypothetical protein